MSRFVSPHPTRIALGVIGGSGVYNLSCLHNPKHYEMDTPFGKPSGPVCVAEIAVGETEMVPCAFLPRHGPHHSFNPSEVNYRANVCALKLLGVEYVLAINAVGSLHEDYKPGDLVLVDQLIDKTVNRPSTFFAGIGIVAHVDFAFPTSAALSQLVFQALCEAFPHARRSAGENKKALGHTLDGIVDAAVTTPAANSAEDFTLHASGTLVVMEGPQFSTRAESLSNKHALGGHLIGMTTCPEAKLAREAEMVYATVAMVTDTDAWQHEVPHVDVAAVMKVVKDNGQKAQLYPPAIIGKLARTLGLLAARDAESPAMAAVRTALEEDPAHNSMQYAVMTHAEFVSQEAKEKLSPLLGAKYARFKL